MRKILPTIIILLGGSFLALPAVRAAGPSVSDNNHIQAASVTQYINVPNLNVILNDDGDYSFLSLDPPTSVRYLQASIDALAGTPIKTLTYCVGAGSDVLYYPTKVASIWGWRKTSDEQKKEWAGRIAKIKAGMEAGIDPIHVAGEQAKKLGLYFFPSYRMNDDHFMFDPFNYPLTGEFWIKHHKEFVIGDSPILSSKAYGNLLDFSHPEVRQYRLNVIKEIIDRYQDIMDGIELDFNRVQVFFPKDKAAERGHLITDMVRQVRQWLDEVVSCTPKMSQFERVG